jgi:hypothetical protein
MDYEKVQKEIQSKINVTKKKIFVDGQESVWNKEKFIHLKHELLPECTLDESTCCCIEIKDDNLTIK